MRYTQPELLILINQCWQQEKGRFYMDKDSPYWVLQKRVIDELMLRIDVLSRTNKVFEYVDSNGFTHRFSQREERTKYFINLVGEFWEEKPPLMGSQAVLDDIQKQVKWWLNAPSKPPAGSIYETFFIANQTTQNRPRTSGAENA